MKRCAKCKLSKDSACFAMDRIRKDGLQPYCRDCYRAWRAANAGMIRRHKQAEYRRNTPAHRERRLRRKYGMSNADYATMLARQDGVCAICRKPPTTQPLVVDHSHATGAVRGLLHANCNLGIGLLGDTVQSLGRAIAYLKGSPQ